jgi:outer membrane receptor for ferrienterochelin and colicin
MTAPPPTRRAATRLRWPRRIAPGVQALSLLAAGTAAAADGAPPAPDQRVEIRSNAADQRRADVAGRQVVGRAELLRHGDARLADALQRVPGITVDNRGQGTELKLGGLGGGYTQVLLNGEPLPRGTSLDSIALDSIERVEIVRGSTVQSSQAIAGSINLVTRRPAAATTREAKLQAASQWGRPQASASLNLGGGAGATTWGVGLVLSHENQLWPASFVQERLEGSDETPTQRARTDKRERDRTEAVSLNPRLAWKHDEDDGGRWQLSTDHSLRHAVSRAGVADRREPLSGPPPAQQHSDMTLDYRRLFWRGRAQGLRRNADGAQTEARLNITHANRDQRARVLGYDFASRLVQDTSVDGLAIDQSAVFQLNHQRPLGATHRLDMGVEWERARRREDRVQIEQSLPFGLPPQNLDERYDARVQRRALYLQDEWSPRDATALQLGVRVEQLVTDSQGNVFDRVRQAQRLVGPVLRLSMRPGAGAGTFKLGLSRGFKLPAPRDVMPRRYVPIEVSPTSPAQVGNPDLRPERAWSLDGSWQDRWSALGAELVLSAALRRIDDVMLDQLSAQPGVPNAPWLLQRFNGGRAWSAALEAELRGQAPHALVAGAPLRWQASLSLMRSRLDDVAGARPALPGQAPWQVKLDLTQRLAAGWTAQLGLEARGAALADLPSSRRVEGLARRSLSAGLSWQPRPRQTWRLSVVQLAATDDVDVKSVRVLEAGTPALYRAREAWLREPVWRLGLDCAF